MVAETQEKMGPDPDQHVGEICCSDLNWIQVAEEGIECDNINEFSESVKKNCLGIFLLRGGLLYAIFVT